MSEDKNKATEGDTFEQLLKKLSTDLGDVRESGVPSTPSEDEFYNLDSVGRFNNDDLDFEAPVARGEVEAILRMFPVEAIEDGLEDIPPDHLRELAVTKLYKLAGVIRHQYELKVAIEGMGGDCDDDLVYSMLSVVGEMGRLRTIIPKLEGHSLDAEKDEGQKE
jgi:hypothetical protein